MGLRKGDLNDLVYEIFEVDEFSSKIGDDKNIVTVSFSIKNKEAANDLMTFIESGYSFVLDADVTPGEQADGKYRVFVEIERNRNIPENIDELLDGVKKLSGNKDFRFRYYKSFRSHDATKEKFEEIIPIDPNDYGIKVNESNLNNYKNFFNKSYVENIQMIDNTLIIKKKYADPLAFEFIDFGKREESIQNITETFDILNSYPEIMFLTKYLGDYNICKYGDKLVFENSDSILVLKRK